MRSVLIGVAIMLTSAAYAGQAEDIAFKAASCWDVPYSAENLTTATLKVTFDDKGYIAEVTALDNRSGKSSEKAFVLSALRALRLCSPFETRGTVTITMDTSQIPDSKGTIDPFK